jgi:peptide/nickel transport system substrate-binding protein
MGLARANHSTSPRRRRGRALFALGGAVAALAVTLAACGGSSGTSGGGTPVTGGTATFAELPNTTPNYIFPFTSSSFFSVSNAELFQYLMYRPLVWIGNGQSVQFNSNNSLVNMPQYDSSGKTLTLTLKPYKWSNGEQVTASDIEFWMNMEKADKTNWGDYTPGYFPDNVTSYKVVNPTTFQLTTDKAYNHNWFLFNELAQITPMPKAWDKTASGPSDCTDKVADCNAVYTYLDSQAKNVSSYASSPLWGVVDGPWKLKAMTSDGHVSMVPNKSYSGSPKPRLAQFNEDPFTSEAAEYNVLRSGGSGSQRVDVGYIPQEDVPTRPAGQTVGSNPVPGYQLNPWASWSINYFSMNQANPTVGPIFQQTYFRQAVQYLENQAAILKGPARNYGYLTTGMVPSFPSTPYESPQEKAGDPFPYNQAKASQLLSSHGWKVVPNGTTTCQNPSLCGPGIKAGQPLQFSEIYANGLVWLDEAVKQLQSNASRVGIKLTIQAQSFDQVVKTAGPNCKVVPGVSCSAWQIANWGGGWVYVPDYYPSGETLTFTGATANNPVYYNKNNDNLVQQSLTDPTNNTLYKWQDYTQTQLPFAWQPDVPYQLTEVANNLKGATPQNVTLAINPENWYFTK